MSELNLLNEYKKINQLIFQNKLPDTIPVSWNHSRTALGKTRIKFVPGKDPLFAIHISNFFLCSDLEYIETLIHEMIHVLIAINGEYKKDKLIHGPIFKKYMNRINHDFPQYSISIKENRPLKIDQSKIRMQNGFYIIVGDKHYFNLYTKNIYPVDRDKIIRALCRNFRITQGEIHFFRGQYKLLATASVRRKVKTLTGKLQYLHNKSDMESLFQLIKKDSLYDQLIQKKPGLFSLF